ncbi:MAG: hypothetical protein R6W74_11155 [Nitrosomonas halophila]
MLIASLPDWQVSVSKPFSFRKRIWATPHALYVALGNAESERQARYRQLFEQHVEGELLTEIRQTLNKGLSLCNERFKAEIEKLTGRRVTARKAGRPAGWRKKDKVCE